MKSLSTYKLEIEASSRGLDELRRRRSPAGGRPYDTELGGRRAGNREPQEGNIP